MNKTKGKLHLRNVHNNGYNFQELIIKVPELKSFILKNKEGKETIQFANPKAVYLLNKALLLHYYQVDFWDIPQQNLVPSIPGRANYIHYLAELIEDLDKQQVKILDIGTGASLVYPIIGNALYGWKFIASDIDLQSIRNAQHIIDKNPHLSSQISLRFQANKKDILFNIIQPGEHFDAVICNPPFFKSKSQANAQTLRKLKGLNRSKTPKLINNFAGKSNELWYPGGELSFVLQYIKESRNYKSQVRWFTSLISNENHLKPLQIELKKSVSNCRIIEMPHGNKKSRILAWTF